MRPGVRYIGTQGSTSERGVSASSAGMSSTTCASTTSAWATSASTMGAWTTSASTTGAWTTSASTTGAWTTSASTTGAWTTSSSTTDDADPNPQSAIRNPQSSTLASATDAAGCCAIGA